MFEKQRLSHKNIKQYLNIKDMIQLKTVNDISPLLQKNYGGDNDCTLTSITCVIKWLSKKTIATKTIYDEVELIGKKYGYTSEEGTFPLVIPKIYQKSLNFFKINKKISTGYFKNIGVKYQQIKQSIDQQNPVLLNIRNDGRNYYKDHTVLIIGYVILKNKHILCVYDNWYSDIAFLDFDKLSPICSAIFLHNK